MIHYELRIDSAQAHRFGVRIRVDEPDPSGQRLSLPAWIPGSYMIRDFARHILAIDASDERGDLPLTKLDKQTWQAPPCQGALIVDYQVYAWDLSVRGAHLDLSHGFGNGSALFLRAVGAEHQPCTLAFVQPEGAGFENWRLATSMPSAGAPEWGFGSYQAADYEDLIDHPFEMGEFELVSFELEGAAHHLVFTGRYRADMARIRDDVQRICAEQIRVFGALPLERYLFLVMVTKSDYGGLEHRHSTALICPREDLPAPGADKPSDGYRRFLGLCSHEYFHLWNVRRIRPKVLAEADLSAEVYTESLWAFEGITSYFDELALVRSGAVPVADYLKGLAETIGRVMSGAGRFKQSVAESSFDAWTRFYKQDENSPNAIVSYYAKGSLLALALDLSLRLRSDGHCTLTDVMRALWRNYGQTGRSLPERGIEAEINRISGYDFDDFYQRYLYGTEDIPLADLFKAFGVGMQLCPGADPKANPKHSLGVRLDTNVAAARLVQVFSAGPAEQAGLAAGDELLAIDGIRVDRASIEATLARYGPGQQAALVFFRRDELRQTRLTFAEPMERHCVLSVLEELDLAAMERRRHWLALPLEPNLDQAANL